MRTFWFCFWLLSVLSLGHTSADDTEIYVASGATLANSRPQVLIIFDTSGSMTTEEEVAQAPFDPNYDYTGTGDKRIYYVKGAAAEDDYPNPAPGGFLSDRYFDWEQNGCATSLKPHSSDSSKSVLEYEGRFTDNIRRFTYGLTKGKRRWKKLPNSIPSGRENYVIDCMADIEEANANNAPSHPNSNLRGEGFPAEVNSTTPYDGTAATADQATRESAASAADDATNFGKDDSVTLFTANYLTWFHSTGTTTRQRIEIARETINSLINSTPGVDFGLAVFNQNYYENEDGGRIVSGIRKMTDASRLELTSTVSSLNASGWTPLCESLFEAYRYYSGGAVKSGRLKPLETPTWDSSIIDVDGNYISPLESCQAQSYVVLMTDGYPTRDNDLDATIKSELGLTNADKYEGNFLPAVAGWMNDRGPGTDVNTDVKGLQKVVTYTIGFSEGADSAAGLLEETAFRGGGQYYAARDAFGLQAALQQIFSKILATNASFTSPSIAANSFDRTQTLDAVYYAMFLPSDRPRWAGNLKKLKINSDGAIVDSNDERAIDEQGNIADTACTVWTSSDICRSSSGSGDGNDVLVGGALSSVHAQSTRRVLTNSSASGGALVGLDRDSLENAVGGEANLMAKLGLTDSSDIDGYVSWLQGIDVDDEDEDGSSTDRRFELIGDPLHSKPLAISYGSTDGVRIVMGTNQGYVHMFRDDDTSVDESWAYYLPDMLDELPELRSNAQSGGHSVYGVDSSPVGYIYDADSDGEIESGDKVWVFFGLRRGGKSYYALNLSEPDSPSLMWEVNNTDSGMEELGQTWSEPVVTTIPGNDGKPVLIVGGGYDLNKDIEAVGTGDNMGRAVFILDAASGTLVHRFVAGGTATSNTTPLGATDSIPAKVSTLDSDGDGVTDRLYATDTGGNVWRIDMPEEDTSKWSAFQFASLGGDVLTSDRRFYAEASVAQTSFKSVEEVTISGPSGDTTTIRTSETPFDAVVVGSGNRAHPNATGTNNELYVLQDRNILTQTFGTADVPYPATITKADLYNVAGDPFASASTADEKLAEQIALGEKVGWYYPLTGDEKSLSAPIVVAGTAYFTTFTPGKEASENACLVGGTGRLYGFSLQEGINRKFLEIGQRLPDTPQILVPPAPDPAPEDYAPQLYFVGVGEGDERKGTVATDQLLVPRRVYFYTD